jgi:hypothetical protein
MTRAFFDQIDDEVRGMVGPALRNFNSERSGRLIKIWYGDPSVHFEVQRLAGTWAPSPDPSLEIGLHLESRDAARNDEILSRMVDARAGWGAALAEAEAGAAFGPMSSTWRRISEVVPLPALDEDFAGEVAERFACYIKALYPLIAPG